MEGINGTLKIKDQQTNELIGVVENYNHPITPDRYFTGYLVCGDVRDWLSENGYDRKMSVRWLFIPDECDEEEPAEW